ncbi:MAG TPA: thiamine pyrophosphate-requiring protein [Pelagibacterium sp.]|uniref:thiamine pyrophosphate-requiring protein n=1 Tax=Pelagibacterium sp. TaxID=1967288 RepID=UPI002B8CBF7D|nr:thiamine pyrophosphate-requiring protein [Pelagibacterium sp.]HWJ87200.1 thiamine pyrophosphate-requiring protein [Pelagibacterium sp.]
MPTPEPLTLTAGGALLARLKSVGVDYIFANSGTDFPPIIEGLAEAAAKDVPLPQALVMPHENAAMGMAHGYYLATGRAQAVIAHTNVGLANCATGAINAAVENIPVLLFSGRTPVTEAGRFGARTVPIGWGQEMRDQAALVREAVKWDYELRFPEQAGALVDRAYAIANSTPKGPVYAALPREVLCEPYANDDLDLPLTMQPVHVAPDASQISRLADAIRKAQFPVIIAQHGAGGADAFAALSALAERWAIPVCHYWALQIAIPTDHPMYAGVDPSWLLDRADLVIVLDSLAPWSQQAHAVRPDATVAHIGPDPLKARMPIRNFRADITTACELADGVLALCTALEEAEPGSTVATRRSEIVARNGESRQTAIANAEKGRDGTMSADYVALKISQALTGRDAVLLSERGCPMPAMTLSHHRAWYQEPHAGGLGWSFPAALGMQLAEPDRLVVATLGDGSYMFANPVACHQIAEALDLPVLVIVMNNAEWAAVRHSVLDIYPQGYASKTNQMPLTGLSPIPDFVKVAEASRAFARRVPDADTLDIALAEALDHIATNRTLALLDVTIRN